jgi:RimJ/RimL family protein N-acetyltransferase
MNEMELRMEVTIDDLLIRTLDPADAPLLVEATREETDPALWGPRPVGPYTPADAEIALHRWTAREGQVSIGVLRDRRLVAAFGLMLDDPQLGAELAYWVRPEARRQGLAGRCIVPVTEWAHRAGLARLWLEIDPCNEASQRVARHGGYRYERRLPHHCRLWIDDDPQRDTWRDCLIWSHEEVPDVPR